MEHWLNFKRIRSWISGNRQLARLLIIIALALVNWPVQHVLCYEEDSNSVRIELAFNGSCVPNIVPECCTPVIINDHTAGDYSSVPGCSSLDSDHYHCLSCSDSVLSQPHQSMATGSGNCNSRLFIGGVLFIQAAVLTREQQPGTAILPHLTERFRPPDPALLYTDPVRLLI